MRCERFIDPCLVAAMLGAVVLVLSFIAPRAADAERTDGRRTRAQSLPDCAASVQPVDVTPIRSPQAVHTAMLKHVAGRDLVEIGTRNGDGMTCFSRVARSALAVELSRPYCDHLNRRSAEEQRAGRPSWTVLCQDYRSAARLDADVFTWWQQYPHLRNMHVLLALRKCVLPLHPPSPPGLTIANSSHRSAPRSEWRTSRKYVSAQKPS